MAVELGYSKPAPRLILIPFAAFSRAFQGTRALPRKADFEIRRSNELNRMHCAAAN
jgi:hypothetical protein